MSKKKIINEISNVKFPKVMYGLEGIKQIFNVSTTTAWKYRHGILKDACTQNGRIIVIDTIKALELFGVPDAYKFVK